MFTVPKLTSDILAISLDAPSSPSINANLSNDRSTRNSWGFGWYPGDQKSAMVTKDPAPSGTSILMEAITDWSNFRSTIFYCKLQAPNKGYTHKEIQPFSRSFAGKDWMFMHNGHLDKKELDILHGRQSRLLEPLGKTDSELAFCNLLSQVQESKVRKLSDLEPQTILSWFQRFDKLGSADMVLTDGDTLVCFHGTQTPKPLYHARIQPPNNQEVFESETAQVILNDPRDTYRTALIISSTPLSAGAWTEMKPGQMIIVRRGIIIWNSAPENQETKFFNLQYSKHNLKIKKNAILNSDSNVKKQQILNVKAMSRTSEGDTLAYRIFEVKHSTYYNYSQPVEHSTHSFRLQPVDDPTQEVISSTLSLSTDGEKIQYEDVFGNQAISCIINQPYTIFSVEAISKVKVFATPPDDHSLSSRQTTIPLAWMPWQRQMMMPYLLPSELPESQLKELTDYAMSFVERNDFHLLKTIEDINLTIYRDYKYVSGSTAISTTPFEVYASRQGVCQDFANLFICLTRLLSIPARYRMGYIYTGANYENKIQSDASHAWAEVYLPFVGWRGFDPTNGCQVAQDHIRVACGRNYIDATPTAGTIYKGGGKEELKVEVKMEEIK